MKSKCFSQFARLAHSLSRPVTGWWLHKSTRVRVAVMYRNDILLQRTSIGSQQWSVPGGGIEKNETSKAAAVREVYEETGIRIAGSDLEFLEEYTQTNGKGWPMITIHLYKIVLQKKETPQILRPIEILEVAWHSQNLLPENCSTTVTKLLRAVNQRPR